jgi:hypothetical protein
MITYAPSSDHLIGADYQLDGLPCVCVINIFLILPIFIPLLAWICFWVDSPQSKSQTSEPSRRAKEEWFRVDEGCAEAVPRKVMLKEESILSYKLSPCPSQVILPVSSPARLPYVRKPQRARLNRSTNCSNDGSERSRYSRHPVLARSLIDPRSATAKGPQSPETRGHFPRTILAHRQ